MASLPGRARIAVIGERINPTGKEAEGRSASGRCGLPGGRAAAQQRGARYSMNVGVLASTSRRSPQVARAASHGPLPRNWIPRIGRYQVAARLRGPPMVNSVNGKVDNLAVLPW
ncbi:MAG: hypothetical protein ACLSGS_10515 [Adlercreutzia sp.]